MFYFFIKIFFYIIILLTIYNYFQKNQITILEIIILLFIFNICIFSLYSNISLVNTFLISIIIIIIYYLYNYLYNKNINNKLINNKVLINRGIINFNELINEKISYNSLVFELKKQGIKDISSVDYCLKHNNNYIVFNKNSIKNYPISIIIDGKILKDNLYSINKSIEWLDKKLEEENLNLKIVNYAYFKDKNIYFITN